MKRRFFIVMILVFLPVLLAAACAEGNGFEPQDLPVIYLEIDGGQEEIDRLNGSSDHSYKCTGTMDVALPDGYNVKYGEQYPQKNLTGLKLKYIRGRGNGSWGFSKNPYKIKFEEKQNLFGMGKNKTWVLLAGWLDNSQIRNALTFWLGEQMGLEYTPQGVFVELVMNGEYLGTYYLCEQVQVDKKRVAIEELKEDDQDLPAIQGGYLLEFCPDDEGPDAFETSRGQMFGNQEPSFDRDDDGWDNDAQMNYIRNYVQQAEDAIYAEDGNPGDYVDLQSLADYWWIQEFLVNGDGFRTDSAHMFKKRFEADGSEGKLHFGPLWDFDESWGNAQIETVQDIGFNNCTFIWADELRQKPEFRALLEERWQVLDAKLEEIVREGGILDQLAAYIRNGWQRDNEKWKDAEDRAENLRGFDEEIEHIRKWIGLRREWVGQNLDRIGIMTFTLTVRGNGIAEKTYEIASDTTVPLWQIEDGFEDELPISGWTFEDGTPVEDFFRMERDITLTVHFAGEEQ